MIYTDDNYMNNILVRRKTDAHKGNFGKVLIFAGSVGMAGAAILCGRAALKSGAGLVRFLLPDPESPLLPILQTSLPEATCTFWCSGMDLSEYSAIVTGSGLGRSLTSKSILTYIIDHYSRTLVLDADALNMISEDPDLADRVRRCQAAVIITPHIGEARRLLHTCEGIAGMNGRKNAVSALAETYNCIAILKGSGTLIAHAAGCSRLTGSSSDHPEDRCGMFSIYQNTTGNPGMATAGSGDTLAGLIGSLAGQGYSPVDAARIGVFIHGKAGDLAAEELGEMGLTASDISDRIPYALKIYY